MPSPKLLTKYGTLAKIESVYATPVALSASTDGVDLIVPAEPSIEYMHDGNRGGKSPASRGGRAPVGRMGRFIRIPEIAVEPAGKATAFSASNLPNIHTLARIAGLAATIDVTPGSEKVTYRPAAAGSEESGTLNVYYRGQKYYSSGTYGSWKWGGEIPGIPRFSVETWGIAHALPEDSSVPSITYPTQVPAKAEGVNLTATIGSDIFTVGKIKSFMVTGDNKIVPRALDNTSGNHGGFNHGVEREITFEAVIEAEALETSSPYLGTGGFHIFELMERAPGMVLGMEVGATQYNIYELAAPAAYLLESPEQADGSASMWALKFRCLPTTLTADDEVSIIVK